MSALRRTLQCFGPSTLPNIVLSPVPGSRKAQSLGPRPPPAPPERWPEPQAIATSPPPEPRAAVEQRLAANRARARNPKPFVWGRRTMTSADWERRWGITAAQRNDLPGGMHPGRLWELSQARKRRGQTPKREAVYYPSLKELGVTAEEFLATTFGYSDDLDVHSRANGYRHIKRPFTAEEDTAMRAVLARWSSSTHQTPDELLAAPFDPSSPSPEQFALLTDVARAVPMHSLRKVRRHLAKQLAGAVWVKLRAREALEGLVKEVMKEREPGQEVGEQKVEAPVGQKYHSKWNRIK